jgi:hypothetical protein
MSGCVHDVMRLLHGLVSLDLCRWFRVPLSVSDERSTIAMLMDHTPMCPCSWYIIQLHDRVVHVLGEFMREAGASYQGRDLRLKVHRIRSGASRDRHGDVVRVDFIAPHRHLLVHVTVTTSARTHAHQCSRDRHSPLPLEQSWTRSSTW